MGSDKEKSNMAIAILEIYTIWFFLSQNFVFYNPAKNLANFYNKSSNKLENFNITSNLNYCKL